MCITFVLTTIYTHNFFKIIYMHNFSLKCYYVMRMSTFIQYLLVYKKEKQDRGVRCSSFPMWANCAWLVPHWSAPPPSWSTPNMGGEGRSSVRHGRADGAPPPWSASNMGGESAAVEPTATRRRSAIAFVFFEVVSTGRRRRTGWVGVVAVSRYRLVFLVDPRRNTVLGQCNPKTKKIY
jgi:hypothetical protein